MVARRAEPLSRKWLALSLAAIALLLLVWRVVPFVFPGLAAATVLPPPRETLRASLTPRADFVGAERCAACHAAEFEIWKRSTHGRAGGAPSPALVIAAFDGKPIRFVNAVVTPRTSGGAYEFVVAENDEAPRTYRVDGVIGGGHMEGGGTQGFVTTLGDGTVRFLPFDWSRHGQFWFCNTASRAERGWVPITSTLRLQDCGDWPPARVLGDVARYGNCQNCHASQLTLALDTAGRRWFTKYSSLAINCESCHGPGRRHIELVSRPAGERGADIGYAALATLDKDASLRVCYQCHAAKDHLRDGFLSGDSLTAFYSLTFPLLGDRQLQPDGRVRTFSYQEAHQFSDCYLNGGLTCTSCHDPHAQTYRDAFGAQLAGRNNDRQCTSCHASKADRVAEHSHHATTSRGSRCTACHMPYLQHPATGDGRRTAVRYARADHSIAIPRPVADSAIGITGACAACHGRKSTAELDRQVRAWWGELKPVKEVVAAQIRFSPRLSFGAAAPLLLGGSADSAGDRHASARFAGVARLLENYVRPDDPAVNASTVGRLEALARHPDEDVRAIALATLHLAKGDDAGVRRALAAALRKAGPRDLALRSRWALALGFMGDRYAGRGELPSAIVAYQRALEVSPGSARLTLALANAQREGGDLPTSVQSYHRSLALDGGQPIAWVNLGIALASAGDTAAAISALSQAAALDPGEPLAWFNLGNIHLARGELDRAVERFSTAAAADPTIAVTHFRLARVWLLEKDYAAALRELRRGLAFDSADAPARDAAAALRKALRQEDR